jgi:hypothetical protein
MTDDWQPIESAPKDGTWVVAWDGETVAPACWMDDIAAIAKGLTKAQEKCLRLFHNAT